MGFTMPSDTSVGNFMDRPGQFHFAVSHAEDGPVFNGSIADAVVLDLTCLAGTEPSQARKTVKLFLNNPNLSHKDGGEFCAKVQARAAIALGLLDPKTPAGQEVVIDWSKAAGRQCVAKLIAEKDSKGKDRLNLDGARIWAVDDPDVAHVPMCAASLKLIGKKPQQAAGATSGKTDAKPAATNGNGNGGHAAQPATPKPTVSAADV